ncbi:hypothetical protein P0D91_00440 [Pseudomonas sp. CBSPBW29]|nr:hypothetical protein P0D91_00440 [Pseudomonas sp. CBSPBW29]
MSRSRDLLAQRVSAANRTWRRTKGTSLTSSSALRSLSPVTGGWRGCW